MDEPVALCNLIVIAVTAILTFRGFRQQAFLEGLMFEPARILRDKEYYRMLSSGFIHLDLSHFVFNMLSLYLFGRDIELYIGVKTFLAVYLGSILGGSLLSLYLHRFHDYRALGASGGVCGIIFASIFLFPGTDIRLMFIPIGIPGPAYALLFMILSFVGIRRARARVAHDAHLGGALIGLLVATAMHPSIVSWSPHLYAAVCVVTLLMFLYTYRYPPYLPEPFRMPHFTWRRRWRRENRGGGRKYDPDEERLDRLLDKINREGMESLSRAERRQLEAIAERKNVAQ
jgi:membrane associated rhomboid family serine protease